jgi:hypothetical protein
MRTIAARAQKMALTVSMAGIDEDVVKMAESRNAITMPAKMLAVPIAMPVGRSFSSR